MPACFTMSDDCGKGDETSMDTPLEYFSRVSTCMYHLDYQYKPPLIFVCV